MNYLCKQFKIPSATRDVEEYLKREDDKINSAHVLNLDSEEGTSRSFMLFSNYFIIIFLK